MPETFDFAEALRRMTEGKQVARIGWNGTGMHAWLVPESHSMTVERKPITIRPYFQLFTAQKDIAVWVPSVSDILADDWTEIYD